MEHAELPKYFSSLLEEDFLSQNALESWHWLPKDVFSEAETRLGIGDRFRLSPLCPTMGFPRYTAEFYQLIYLFSGSYTVTAGESQLTLSAGQALLLKPGAALSVAPCRRSDVAVHLALHPELLEVMPWSGELLCLSEQSAACQVFYTQRFPKAAWYMEEMCCEHFDPERHTYMMMPQLLELLLASLDRCEDFDARKQSGAGELTVMEIQRYIKTNYARCTLQTTAKRFGFSPNYLSYMLKKATGRGFQELRQTEALTQSARLLRETDLTVSQIANAVGIRNMTHYYTLFHERYGVTPAQYRLQH